MWLVLIGVIGTIAQMSLAEALKQADTTVVMPFDFLKLVWASLLGVTLFGEFPDAYTLVGALVIFASTFYLIWRESRGPGAAMAPGPEVEAEIRKPPV